MIVTKSTAHVIREAARKTDMRTLREDGLTNVLEEVTTVEEVLRVTQLE